MENKKQTAVEWLHEITKQREPDKFDWNQAKAIEKEQIKEAFKHGELPPLFVNFDAEEYYNKTYSK